MQQQGKFTLLKELGKGRYGTVHEAEDESGLHWAVRSLPLDPVGADKLARELSVLPEVRSPFVVQVLACFSSSRNHYLVQELCSGGSLQAYLAQHGPVPHPHLRKYVHQMLLGLAALQEKEILHKDLRPANLLLTNPVLDSASVKIGDFGLSGVLEMDRSSAYMAPEALAGRPCAFPADIWSFAVTAYELATGQVLFPGPEIAIQQLNFSPLQGLPPALTELLTGALALDPQQRPTLKALLSHPYFADLPENNPLPVLSKMRISRQYDSIPRGKGRKLLPIESVVFLEDDYLIIDYEEESHSQELQAANSLCTELFTQLATIEDIEVKSLDKSALCYCHFSTRLHAALQQLYTCYNQLELSQEFAQFYDIWANATAIVLKLQSKLLSLEGTLPLFLDEKIIKVCLFGEDLVATKAELEERHRQSLALITKLADDLTSPKVD